MAQHVVILTPGEHDELLSDQATADRVRRHNMAGASRDELEAVANEFIRHFDPERAEEWGHVSFCFCRALETLVRK